ncbi:MAG: hypothetical protein F4103_11295 [Boseongicola sp. SB0673_bin_14]|nr:hypothetical protein [Boseongicola sp. SB0673_bin_14]
MQDRTCNPLNLPSSDLANDPSRFRPSISRPLPAWRETVAERELMLPRSLTKRLANHARPSDVTEGYAADWTVDQLREPAQWVAGRIDELSLNRR